MVHRVNIIQQIVAASAEHGQAWIKLLPVGTFTLRDGRGPFSAPDRAALQRIVDATSKRLGETELMIDYDHQVVFGAKDGVGGRAEAAGWVKQLEARDDGIWARVEWTEEASAKIKSKAYRYLSPLFAAAKDGRVTLLLNASLVNMPALDLEAVAAAFSLNPQEEPNMKKIAAALGLDDSASEDAILAAIGSRSAAIAAAAGLKADASHEEVVKSVGALLLATGKVAVAAGLKSDASADEVVAAMAKTVPAAQVASLQTELTTLKAGLKTKEVDELVSAAMKAGKVSPANEAWARGYCEKDPEGFKAFAANAPVLVGTQLGDKTDPPETDLDPNAIAAKAQAYMAEQAKLGITVSASAAVDHVQQQASKAAGK